VKVQGIIVTQNLGFAHIDNNNNVTILYTSQKSEVSNMLPSMINCELLTLSLDQGNQLKINFKKTTYTSA